jgi:hypothetical protein
MMRAQSRAACDGSNERTAHKRRAQPIESFPTGRE